MKSNAQQALLWLYPAETQIATEQRSQESSHADRWVRREQLLDLLGDLSDSGKRSLLSYMESNGLILRHKSDGVVRYASTEQGVAAITELFPALQQRHQDWNGEWLQVVFMDAPEGDEGFRYLRSSLLENGAKQLARGVYIYPEPLPAQIEVSLQQLYRGYVVVQRLAEWEFGDERSTVMELFGLSDVAATYSGISRELKRVIEKRYREKSLTDSQKMQVYSAFHRFHSILPHDLNLVPVYMPDGEQAIEVLGRLQWCLKDE